MKVLGTCCDIEAFVVLERLHAGVSKKAAKKKPGTPSSKAFPQPAQAEGAEPVFKEARPARRKRVQDGQQHIKSRLLAELESITTAMLKNASKGGTAPLKLLWELGKMHEDPTAKPRRKEVSLSSLLTKELQKRTVRDKQAAATE